MHKGHWYRKMAVLMALVFVAGLFLAACSSSSGSSTDDALGHPGDNYIGSVKISVDPINSDMDITPIKSTLSINEIPQTDGWEVTTGTVNWDNAGTITAPVSLKWLGPDRLERVSIRTYDFADAVGATTSYTNADGGFDPNHVCISAGPDTILQTVPLGDDVISGTDVVAGPCGICDSVYKSGSDDVQTASGMPGEHGAAVSLQESIANGCNYLTYTYVGDDNNHADGAVSVQTCQDNGDCSNAEYNAKRLMSPGCGTSGNIVTTEWQLFNNEAGFPQYTLYAHVYGDKIPADYRNDPRYDYDTGGVYIGFYEPDWSLGAKVMQANEAAPVPNGSVLSPDDIVYALVWLDYPGASRPIGEVPVACEDGSGDTYVNCTDGSGPAFQSYDYYYVEDDANLDAPSTAGYWQSYKTYFTGFMYAAGGFVEIQWDPSALLPGDTYQSVNLVSGGGTTITKLIQDHDLADQFSCTPLNVSRWTGRAMGPCDPQFDLSSPATAVAPPMPDGRDAKANAYMTQYAPGDFVQGDFIAASIAFQAVGPVGSGGYVMAAPSGSMLINAGLAKAGATNYTGTPFGVAQKSANYPIWKQSQSYQSGPGGSVGHYNEQIAYICIE